jgi:hypothetical protein
MELNKEVTDDTIGFCKNVLQFKGACSYQAQEFIHLTICQPEPVEQHAVSEISLKVVPNVSVVIEDHRRASKSRLQNDHRRQTLYAALRAWWNIGLIKRL